MVRLKRVVETNISNKTKDTDMSLWFNEDFLNKKFDEFNHRFFKNRLPKIPVKIKGVSKNKQGSCNSKVSKQQLDKLYKVAEEEIKNKNIRSKYIAQDIVNQLIKEMKIEQHVDSINITDGKWADRFYIENTLLHEMCHAYQQEVLCEGLLYLINADNQTSKGTFGHGVKFFEAADLVNNSPINSEGFNVKQYGSEGEMTRKAYKSTDGLLSVECINNMLAKISFISKANIQQAIAYMNYDTYFFSFSDGDSKAEFKQTKPHLFLLTDPFVRKIENAIKEGKLIPYAINKKGVYNNHVISDGESKDPWKYINTNHIMDCGTVGFQCSQDDVNKLFSGNNAMFAKRIADVLKKRFLKDRHYLNVAPETFESMFSVADDSLYPVIYSPTNNTKSNVRIPMDDLLKKNNVSFEYKILPRNCVLKNELAMLDSVKANMENIMFNLLNIYYDMIQINNKGDIIIEQE